MAKAQFLTGVACAAALMLIAPAAGVCATDSTDDAVAVQWLGEETAIASILDSLRDTSSAEITVLRNVRVVDPIDHAVRDGQSIVVSLGRIAWVGDARKEPPVQHARIIDGKGRYASPGLTDMHVHTQSASGYLLDLANGVTTIREMDGFPWMLAVRDAVNNDRMVGPTSYVAGTILNYASLGGWAVVVRDGETARRVVRQQAACGYDFIKVHNLMPARVFDAIAAEARREDMDLVGHVPHHMTVRYAAEHGMRTMEHLKGYLDDATLQLGDTDYALADNPDLWFTPTLYAGHNFVPRAEREAMLHAPAAAYVPARTRADWRGLVDAPEDNSFRLNARARELKRQIIAKLLTNHAQFLAGTDAANYPFQTMGFALIEELRLLNEAGVPREQVLRAATTAPAAAMRMKRDFGRIARGMRADIVLTDANPLEDPTVYAQNSGVMEHGRWINRAALNRAMAKLAALYARDAPAAHITRASAEAAAEAAEAAVKRGFVFNTRVLTEAGDAFRRARQDSAADRLERIAVAPAGGACAAIRR